jgi:hypothetical protein
MHLFLVFYSDFNVGSELSDDQGTGALGEILMFFFETMKKVYGVYLLQNDSELFL